MRKLFGVCNSSIIHVVDLIKHFNLKTNNNIKPQLLGLSDKVDKKAIVIIVQTVSLFSKNRVALNNSDSIVFVIDSPVLCEYLKPIHLLDVEPKKLSYSYKFSKIKPAEFCFQMNEALGSKNVKIKQESVDVIPTLLNSQLSSMLNPIQDYLYRVRDIDKRLVYQKLIYEWLVSDADTKKLGTLIQEGDKPSKYLTDLLANLDTELATNTRTALKDAFHAKAKTGKGPNYKAICKKYNVAPFDIRYSMKLLRRFGRYEQVNEDVAKIYKCRSVKKK